MVTGSGRLAEEFAATSPRPVTLRIFEQSSGANMHCQLDNLPLSAAVIFDWLDDTMPPRPEHYSWHPPKAASWPAAN